MLSRMTSIMWLLLCSLCVLMTSCGARMLRRPETPEPVVLCASRHFYSLKLDKCVTCSVCPRNQIIQAPCHGTHDTKCGPFYDLQKLQQESAAIYEDPIIVQRIALELQRQQNATSASSTNGTGSSLDSAATEDQPKVNSQLILLNEARELAAGLISDWKSLTVFACVALVLVIVILIVGIYCIKRYMFNLSKVYDYNKAPSMDHV